jgi:hypothetical protein
MILIHSAAFILRHRKIHPKAFTEVEAGLKLEGCLEHQAKLSLSLALDMIALTSLADINMISPS